MAYKNKDSYNIWAAVTRVKRREASLCQGCAKPIVEGRSLCKGCRMTKTKGEAARRAVAIASGMCRCGRCAPELGKSTCTLCLEQSRDSTRHSKAIKRAFVYRYFGDKCKCCGEVNPLFLSLDHVNNDGYIERRAGTTTARIYAKLERRIKAGEKIKDFQLYCFNCNLGKPRNGGICPHNLSVTYPEVFDDYKEALAEEAW